MVKDTCIKAHLGILATCWFISSLTVKEQTRVTMTDGATTLHYFYGNHFVIWTQVGKKEPSQPMKERTNTHISEKKKCFHSHLLLLWSHVNFSETRNMLSQICSVTLVILGSIIDTLRAYQSKDEALKKSYYSVFVISVSEDKARVILCIPKLYPQQNVVRLQYFVISPTIPIISPQH